MNDPEPVSVTALELYRQGARLEHKLDKMDDKLDGHGESITALQHRADEADRWIGWLKAELVKLADNRRANLALWIAGGSLLAAVISMIMLLVKAGGAP